MVTGSARSSARSPTGPSCRRGSSSRRRACSRCGKVARDRDRTCKLGDQDAALVRRAGRHRASSVKLIDAQFPPYEQVIPKDHKQDRRRRPRLRFMEALRRASADVVGDLRREDRARPRRASRSRATTPTSARCARSSRSSYDGDGARDRLQPEVLHRAARRDGRRRGDAGAGRRARSRARAAGRAATITSASSCRCASESRSHA